MIKGSIFKKWLIKVGLGTKRTEQSVMLLLGGSGKEKFDFEINFLILRLKLDSGNSFRQIMYQKLDEILLYIC